jgi:rhamnose transport system permease protein
LKLRLAIGIALLISAYFLSPRLFSGDSLNSILLLLPLILTVGLGELLVVISGGIDISVGSILGCSAMSCGVVLKARPDLPLPLCFLVGATSGLLLGIINALFVAKAKLPPLIVTIGTLASFRGLAFLIGRGETVTGSSVPDALTKLSNRGLSLGSVTLSWLAITCLFLTLATAWFLKFRPLGRAIFAFGGQPEASVRRGISPSKVQLFVYSFSGLLAGIAGVMYLARFGQVQPGTAGNGLELTVIATVAIAGAKLTGGVGRVANLVFAAFLMAAITVTLSTLGIDANWQMLVYGLVLLVMVCGDGHRRRKETALL